MPCIIAYDIVLKFKYELKIRKTIRRIGCEDIECNERAEFCNKLLVYFADEVGMVGFAECQHQRFFYLKIDTGRYLVV